MPLGKRLSETEAAKIDAWIEAGKTQTYCAEKLNRSRKAVQSYLKNRKCYFNPHKNGSQKALSERDKRTIARHISLTGDSLTATRHALGIEASNMTVWRTVTSTGARFATQRQSRSPNLRIVTRRIAWSLREFI